jgi:hypothetical protein
MAEQIVLNWTDPNSVRKVVKVQARRRWRGGSLPGK